jgi:hypothetical protein
MKIITPKHNQKKENKENWGNFSCEKMKEKKYNTRAHEVKSNENLLV